MTQYNQLTWSGDSALPQLLSKSVARYTLTLYIKAARKVMNGIRIVSGEPTASGLSLWEVQ